MSRARSLSVFDLAVGCRRAAARSRSRSSSRSRFAISREHCCSSSSSAVVVTRTLRAGRPEPASRRIVLVTLGWAAVLAPPRAPTRRRSRGPRHRGGPVDLRRLRSARRRSVRSAAIGRRFRRSSRGCCASCSDARARASAAACRGSPPVSRCSSGGLDRLGYNARSGDRDGSWSRSCSALAASPRRRRRNPGLDGEAGSAG